ncbi:DUF3592 domain-containing protein [Hyalangium minutum]|uniref:DUF3592 domain-containing protein n=1 Tax=Hyalangium minutum TaxID=394096 RepID=A0A085VTY2_9BACT|nr:DUF3592 domain-containing protein [Hyalangium minutum]KFE58895.1 hypothetical protein DB31_6192 [Hyalangium minutum]
MNRELYIVLYLGLGLMALWVFFLVRFLRLRSKGLIVQGVIVRHESRKFTLRGMTVLDPLVIVRFTSPQAGEMECQIQAATHLPRFQVGQSLWVSHDPEKPEQLGRSIDQLLMPPFICGFFGTMMLLVYVVKALGF